jgi:hypothetical protein
VQSEKRTKRDREKMSEETPLWLKKLPFVPAKLTSSFDQVHSEKEWGVAYNKFVVSNFVFTWRWVKGKEESFSLTMMDCFWARAL